MSRAPWLFVVPLGVAAAALSAPKGPSSKAAADAGAPATISDDERYGPPSQARWDKATPHPAENFRFTDANPNAPLPVQKNTAVKRPPPGAVHVARAPKMPALPAAGPLAEPAPSVAEGSTRDLLMHLAVPEDNPQTPEKIALGKRLFFEPRLSADGTVSCATCHDPAKGFTDRLPASIGIDRQLGQRNAPTVLNAMFYETQFWDGRATLLEDQAKLPVTNPIEMGMESPDKAVEALRKAGYEPDFQKAFGRPLNFDDVARAVAAYERTQFDADSPFDRFLAGDEKALDASARRGWTLFNGKGNCMSCHALNRGQPLGTDNKFHNIGVAARDRDFVALAREGRQRVESGDVDAIDQMALQTKFTNLGRFLVSKQPQDIGSFKTSALRDLLVTAPYFHDGSAPTLWDVIDHYNKGGEINPFLDGGIQPLGLSEGEIDDLVAFLASLTGSRYYEQGMAELKRQRAVSRKQRPLRDTAAAMGKQTAGPIEKQVLGDIEPEPKQKDPARLGGR
jgi:cytochrome c peroxidase